MGTSFKAYSSIYAGVASPQFPWVVRSARQDEAIPDQRAGHSLSRLASDTTRMVSAYT